MNLSILFLKNMLKLKRLKKEGSAMIEKTIKIGKLLEEHPEKADILLEAGMHCLGCMAAHDETLEEACEVHGIDVDELVEKLNA